MPRHDGSPSGLVFVPCAPWLPGAAEPVLAAEPRAAGPPVVTAYRNQQRLVAARGPDQPWVAVPRRTLLGLLAAAGHRTVLLDGRPVPTGGGGRA